MEKKDDEYYMNLALKEAAKGMGYTSPNPMVGAVIVKEGRILAAGYHKRYGLDHAEVDAIKKCSPSELTGAVMYVTLEPCCHYGNTPPCTEAIIKAGIKKVVIAALDEDPRVKDKAVQILKQQGIEVKSGILADESRSLNSIYFFNKKHKRPYIVLKAAMTLDGKIAAATGHSKWISNEKARKIAHALRLRLKGICIGRKSIINDAPRLNCRLKGFEDKPTDKLIFSSSEDPALCASFGENGGKSFFISPELTKDPAVFLDFCKKQQFDSLLLEGGSGVYSWFLNNNLVDHLFLFYKPAFLGNDGIAVYNRTGITEIGQLAEFKTAGCRTLDNNIMVEMVKDEQLDLLGWDKYTGRGLF